LQFRSKDNNALLLDDPWLVSSALHGLLLLAIAVVLIAGRHHKTTEVDIRILEAPKPAVHPERVRVIEPKALPEKPAGREVFGISPKSVSSEQGEEVKAGNTVAKAPDREILKPGDPDALPIPSEEYLVTSMPEMQSEVRIPYPAEARKRGVQGAVVINLLIDESGKVRDAALIEGPDAELNAAATAAAKGFRFSPAMIRNKPVAVRIRYVYRFVLER
jgi:periplasmic protein TonB